MVGPAGSRRVSDAEREQAVAELGEHCAAGRLSLDELSDRVGAVHAAATRVELDAVLTDLVDPARAPQPGALPLRPRRVRRSLRDVLRGRRGR